MENEERQRELFEFADRPKRIFPSLGNIFRKNDFENKYMVTMSPERLVFVTIGLVMALVLVYALGVERGRALAFRLKPAPVVSKAQPAAPKAKAALPATPQRATPAVMPPAVKPAAAPSATPPAVKPTATAAFYTIVACTFTKESAAAAETNRLNSEALDAYVYQSDSYFQVCAGKFADPVDAKSYLAKVRRYFKDAYIKFRQ